MAYENFLNQDEVDDILATLSGEKPEDEAEGKREQAGGVRPYDLGSPDRVVRRRMHTLELINERFARRMRAVFMNFMRRNADISVRPIQVLKYSDFERNLPVPSNLNLVKFTPLRGTALVVFDPTLVFLIIENMFGGNGRSSTRVEGRDFTATEQRIIRRLLGMTLDAYTQAWDGIYPIEHSYIRSEMHTKFASVTDPHEVVLVTPIHIEFGTRGGLLNLCLPYSMIEPIRELLISPYQDAIDTVEESRWGPKLSSELRSVNVEMVVDLTKINLTFKDLMNLEVGSVIPFDLPKSVVARINKIPILECEYGTSADGKRYAVRVKNRLNFGAQDLLNENARHDIQEQ